VLRRHAAGPTFKNCFAVRLACEVPLSGSSDICVMISVAIGTMGQAVSAAVHSTVAWRAQPQHRLPARPAPENGRPNHHIGSPIA
jgi:hypothetical protein